MREDQVQQDPKSSEKTGRTERIKSLMIRGAAVLKKAAKIKEQMSAYTQAPKKMRKRRVSLEAAFEKEKKSHGKRKK